MAATSWCSARRRSRLTAPSCGALNHLRLDDLTLENHKRTGLLETALALDNNGNGIGFVMAGTVVNKRLLHQIASAAVALVLFLLPLVVPLPVSVDPASVADIAAAATCSCSRAANATR